jgi:RHS repeat-associated protein
LGGEDTEEHSEKDMLKSTPTTQLVSKIELSDGRTIAYEYDAEERITKVTDSVEGITEYTYDALGQLVSETKDGQAVNTMTYDNYGNIVSKNGKAYVYDQTWKDKLISYNGQAIAYDKQGNPTTYLGNALTWEKGRQLKSFGSNTYTYNANGIRNSKTVDGIRHDFYLDGGKILKEVWNGNVLETVFDNEDSVCGIIYNGTPYYFLKNLQGDIIAITDNSGNVVARYSYDAWGVCTIAQDISGCNIATTNPFRYRGYYYDTETELYYLQSRYYDAEVGRFLNGDMPEFAVFEQSVLGHNLFGYCGNEPVGCVDYSGFATTSYSGIKCKSANKGFSVNMHYKFLSKSFCTDFAKHVISVWGKKGKYCKMKKLRIAMELFAHAVLFVLGITLYGMSILTFVTSQKAERYFLNNKLLIYAVAEYKAAKYLIDHSKTIEVNSDEKWYRVAAFGIIWGFF